jgi:hypothetical protein
MASRAFTAEIHQHLIHHARVGMEEQRLRREFELHLDGFTEGAHQHFGHGGDGLRSNPDRGAAASAAAEQQQLAGQGDGALNGFQPIPSANSDCSVERPSLFSKPACI